MGGRELWFERAEFDLRVARARAVMRERDVDVLLAVHPMSVTYLTGFFSTAYLLFSLAIDARLVERHALAAIAATRSPSSR